MLLEAELTPIGELETERVAVEVDHRIEVTDLEHAMGPANVHVRHLFIVCSVKNDVYPRSP